MPSRTLPRILPRRNHLTGAVDNDLLAIPRVKLDGVVASTQETLPLQGPPIDLALAIPIGHIADTDSGFDHEAFVRVRSDRFGGGRIRAPSKVDAAAAPARMTKVEAFSQNLRADVATSLVVDSNHVSHCTTVRTAVRSGA